MSEPVYFDPESAQTKIYNMAMDFFYKHIRLGKTNQEIFREAQKRSLPPFDETQLNGLRVKFKTMEQKQPEKMARFRKNLGLP